MLEKIETWLPAIALAGALIAACSSSTANEKSGTGGSGGSAAGGSSAGQSGSSGLAGSNAGSSGSSAGGQAGSSAGSGGGAGTSTGGAAGRGGASGGGAAGTSSSRGGSSGAAGQAGSGGNAGSVGPTGGTGGGPPGTLELDLLVTVGIQSSHITSCVPDTVYNYSNRLTTYPNGNHVGTMSCKPEPEGSLYVYSLSVQTFPEAVGTHDASALRITCDLAAGGCSGVGSVIVSFRTDTNAQEIASFGADAKSGTFTLDAFTADGHVSGSMDLTMTKGTSTVRITGSFKATLHDCGLMGSATFDPCTGRTG